MSRNLNLVHGLSTYLWYISFLIGSRSQSILQAFVKVILQRHNGVVAWFSSLYAFKFSGQPRSHAGVEL